MRASRRSLPQPALCGFQSGVRHLFIAILNLIAFLEEGYGFEQTSERK